MDKFEYINNNKVMTIYEELYRKRKCSQYRYKNFTCIITVTMLEYPCTQG